MTKTMTDQQNPVVVVSAHTMGLAVARALGSRGVPVILVGHDERDFAQASKYVRDFVKVSDPEECEAEFLEGLERCGDRHPGSLLMPTSDESLVAVSKHAERLGSRFVVACPDWEVTRQIIDKQFTHVLAERLGVDAPKTLVPHSVAEVKAYAAEVEFPCLVKPCQSHLFFRAFGTKMIRVQSPAEMLDWYRQSSEVGIEVMLQELIPGDDDAVVNYNAYAWQGEPLAEFTAEHVRAAPPHFGSPRVALSRNIPEVIAPGRALLAGLKFNGFACTEFKRDARDGRFKLMEINGRHNLSGLLAVRCGVDFPWVEYQHRMEGQRPVQTSFEEGVYWIDMPRDLGYSLKSRKLERLSAGQYVRPYRGPKVFAICDWRDPGPIVKRLAFLGKKAIQGLTGAGQVSEPEKREATPSK